MTEWSRRELSPKKKWSTSEISTARIIRKMRYHYGASYSDAIQDDVFEQAEIIASWLRDIQRCWFGRNLRKTQTLEFLFAQHVKVAPGKINLIDSKVISGSILSAFSVCFPRFYSNKGWQKKGVWTKGEIMRKLIGCNTNTHTHTSVCSLDNSFLGCLVASLGCKECHWVP